MAAEKKLLQKKKKKRLNKNDVGIEYYTVVTMTKCDVFKL